MSDGSRWFSLPPESYFEEKALRRERDVLFASGPRYVGHELMVPKLGDYRVLDADEGRMLIRTEHGIQLVSNICAHRHTIMLQGSGNVQRIVCPLHRWTYDRGGKLVGAPRFGELPCDSLSRSSLSNWRGLLFEGGQDVVAELDALSVPAELDFKDYVLERVDTLECSYNWKCFIELFQDMYHVENHPGLSRFVSSDHLRWSFGEHCAAHTVDIRDRLTHAGTPTFRRWQDALLRYNGDRVPQCGTTWVAYFPDVTIEFYPFLRAVSYLVPRGPEKTTNVVELYVPRHAFTRDRELVDSSIAAYLETAVEDDDWASRMFRARKSLYERGLDYPAGMYHQMLELGTAHFHAFMARSMGYEDAVRKAQVDETDRGAAPQAEDISRFDKAG